LGDLLKRGRQAKGMWHPTAQRQQQFESVALPHLDALYRTACRLTGSREQAEDLVQETYLRAYAAFAHFDGQQCRAWLFTILRHTYISQLRQAGRAPTLVDLEQDIATNDHGGWACESVEDEVLATFLSEDLERALAALPASWRMAVVLADIEELSYAEIAQVMDCPIGTVMSRLYRGRRRLQALLVCERALVAASHEAA
jgi:RNA polymerase sigma-70 factor (ECF subfamily)